MLPDTEPAEPSPSVIADPPPTPPGGGALDPFDLLPLPEQLRLLNARDALVPALVAAAAGQVAALVQLAVETVAAGGRVLYVGAGSAGRIAAQDAAEVGPTFGVADDVFTAVVAGGAAALRDAAEGLEDDADAGRADLAAERPGPGCLVVGVSASGSTPYTVAAVREARRLGARTACVVNAPGSALEAAADVPVVVPTGAEAVEGSTRLAAGTAQKLVLNQVSTLTMTRLGHVYGRLMIGVRTDNAKLVARARRAVALAAGVGTHEAAQALEACGGDAKAAVVSLRLGVPAGRARELLARCAGDVRSVLGERG